MDIRRRCCKFPRYGSCHIIIKARPPFASPCRTARKACSNCPLLHCCNGLDGRWGVPQTAKSNRVKSPGGKTPTRPPQVENITYIGSNNGDAGRPMGPWITQRRRQAGVGQRSGLGRVGSDRRRSRAPRRAQQHDNRVWQKIAP